MQVHHTGSKLELKQHGERPIGAVDGIADRVAYARAIALPAPLAGRTPTRERARRGARALARLTRP